MYFDDLLREIVEQISVIVIDYRGTTSYLKKTDMGLSCGATTVKYVLFFFNFLIWVCGAALLGIGIWILAAHSNASYYLHIANLDFGLVEASAITLCVVGALVFVVAGLGCCGACKENTGCLTAFSVILVILLVFQLIAVILAGALHSQIVRELAKAMNQTMVNNYGQSEKYDDVITESWNFMQMEMQCCGVLDGPRDWQYTKWYQYNKTEKGPAVPQSCCVKLIDRHNYTHPVAIEPEECYHAAFNTTWSPEERNKHAYYFGCEDKLDKWFMSSLAVLITGVVIIILVQITVLVMACCLKSSIQNSYISI